MGSTLTAGDRQIAGGARRINSHQLRPLIWQLAAQMMVDEPSSETVSVVAVFEPIGAESDVVERICAG